MGYAYNTVEGSTEEEMANTEKSQGGLHRGDDI